MAENKTVLREASNVVTIEGTLAEVKHTEWKSGKGLNIELDIEVAPNEVHTVKGFSKYKKADGTDNAIAKGYQTIISEYKSIAEHGRDEADKVRITQGKIGLNEYYSQGILKAYPQLTTNFVNRLDANEEFNPRAEFDVELFVKNVTEEKVKGEETGRVNLNGYIPLYGGKVIPFEFVVTKEGSQYVENNYEKGSTVNVFGKIINFKEQKVTTKTAAFGEDKKEITTNSKREYLITGGNDPYDEDSKHAFNADAIKKALTEREIYLDGLKNESSNENNKKSGFGGSAPNNKPSKPVEISDDDLPF
ncbi:MULTISPECIES: hypothetical protein [Bacillus amyloliquefaciens group]|uniref:hypothetical protein n=1 Tax=Bacillus amyloliquefaciens group TaxID=1938374 RepID=UPI000779A780|nr:MULTISPECIES: hypothetical protein [Bacillus amyloliquefaciens group]KYC94880.1 hypothetical protein B425_1790 [Bacillus amyloliquefaciens]MEC1250320.1 hypothetical protein [Bacillus amyloliquefaciens]MEC2254383.1 hypothetical protein [Bacillus amyloliquefaciens]MED0832216.1 hypothetical protein [Bacillus amyloliquefaciens]MED1579990.1 hypothetical protein [Bacillus amyloliquefaciens]